MRRKRFQHTADTLCHMLCGWRLSNSFKDLERLGSGTLTVDAITGACQFNSQPINGLAIAEELRAWLHTDLAAHNIAVAMLQRAVLSAQLTFTATDASRRQTLDQHLDKTGQPIRKGAFHRVRLRCTSEVATNDAAYRSQYDDIEEWPVGWPAT